MEAGQRILLIDGLTETEAVLRAVLEPRGLEVDRVRSRQALSKPADRQPSVVVLHADSTSATADRGWRDVPRIVIGSTPPEAEDDPAAAAERFLEKPFQYGELIRAIESLLSSAGC